MPGARSVHVIWSKFKHADIRNLTAANANSNAKKYITMHIAMPILSSCSTIDTPHNKRGDGMVARGLNTARCCHNITANGPGYSSKRRRPRLLLEAATATARASTNTRRVSPRHPSHRANLPIYGSEGNLSYTGPLAVPAAALPSRKRRDG